MKLILERLDKEGKLLERMEHPSKSFTKGFIELLYVAHAQVLASAPYSMTDIGAVVGSVDSEASYTNTYGSRGTKGNLMIGSAPGHSQVIVSSGYEWVAPYYKGLKGEHIGIQVGAGTTAVTPTDTALATRIAHGRSLGQLEYGGCELIGIAFADPNGELTIRRYFTNASGASITVNEVGIYSVGTRYSSALSLDVWVFLIAHDIVSLGIVVANGELLRVTYVVQITV